MDRLALQYLLLIKHSLPEIVENVPAKNWHLSQIGRQRCEPLAKVIAPYSPKLVISSSEVKAQETGDLLAKRLGINCVLGDNLHEHQRDQVPFLSTAEFHKCVMLLFKKPGELVMGSETANQAHKRFEQAVHDLLVMYPQKSLAIVTHGTVISLFVSRAAGLDPFPLWQRLGLPSAVVFSLPKMELIEIIESVE